MLNWSSPPWVRFLGATPRTLPERCPARTDRSLRWLPMACCIYRYRARGHVLTDRSSPSVSVFQASPLISLTSGRRARGEYGPQPFHSCNARASPGILNVRSQFTHIHTHKVKAVSSPLPLPRTYRPHRTLVARVAEPLDLALEAPDQLTLETALLLLRVARRRLGEVTPIRRRRGRRVRR
jgi:hypothetical protein